MGRVGSGVEVRDSSIRLFFVHEGQRIRETLTLNGAPLPPTPANIKHAHRLAAEVKRKIAIGAFSFTEFFPDSPRAQAAQEPAAFGTLADLWLKSQGRLSAATKDQYGTAVRFWKRAVGEAKLVKDVDHKFLAAKIGGYWRPCLIRIGVRWRKPYNCRHTYATAALMRGVPPAYVAAQLGHSLKMLFEKYARWIPGADGGNARAMMAAAMANSSPEVPQPAEIGNRNSR